MKEIVRFFFVVVVSVVYYYSICYIWKLKQINGKHKCETEEKNNEKPKKLTQLTNETGKSKGENRLIQRNGKKIRTQCGIF